MATARAVFPARPPGLPVTPDDETVIIQLRSAAARDRRATLLVALAATVVSVAATVYFYRQHAVLGIRDSYSHLEISRRVLVGESVGIAQLGGIWLPLPHVLQSLFAWNWTLYRTGLAGSLVSMAGFVGSVTFIYKIVRILDARHIWPAVAGAAVFATNADLLYQQSTSMDELPCYCFILCAVHWLLKWSDTGRPGHVLTAGLSSMAAMMCRYEAWFLGPIYVLCVVVMSRRLGYGWRDTRGLGLVIAVFGVLIPAGGWMAYNWLIFGSPVNFLYGPNSSADQMKGLPEPEIGDWRLTFKAFGTAVTADIGLAVLGAGVLALAVFLARERLSAKSLPVLSLIGVVPFLLYSIEGGQVGISTPTVNGGLFNLRFGLFALLPAAILIGYLAGRVAGRLPARLGRPAGAALLAVLAALSATTFATHGVVLAAEAAANRATQATAAQTGDFLAAHTRGLILIDMVRNERVAFPVLDRTVYSGTRDSHGNLWNRALRDPRAYGITVLVMRTTAADRDLVSADLANSPQLGAYRLVYQNPDYAVYAR